jgi:hypothetical protein
MSAKTVSDKVKSAITSPILSTALVSAFVSTAVLFIFHAFPLNTKIIEKHIAADKDSIVWWGVASVYYFIVFLIVALPMEWLSRKWLCVPNSK